MNRREMKLTYVQIDKLLESIDKDWFKDIKWKYVTEEEIESLLKGAVPKVSDTISLWPL